MSFDIDEPILCHTFGVGMTVDDDNPAIFIVMGESEDAPPTHGVLMTAEGFADFMKRCLALAMEVASINRELDGLEGAARHARLEAIQGRYSAGLN
jgi:hypothetical protein